MRRWTSSGSIAVQELTEIQILQHGGMSRCADRRRIDKKLSANVSQFTYGKAATAVSFKSGIGSVPQTQRVAVSIWSFENLDCREFPRLELDQMHANFSMSRHYRSARARRY
jgi:hypothetical protein